MNKKTNMTLGGTLAAMILGGAFSGACVVKAGATPQAGTGPAPTSVAAAPTAAPLETDGTRTGPVVCQGGDDIVLENQIIESAGDGIIAQGTCSITLINTQVRAGGWAVRVQGAGDLVVRGSSLSGRQGAFMLEGAASVQSEGSTFTGPMVIEGAGDLVARDSTFHGALDSRGAGEYVDQGGNTWNQSL